MNICYLEILRHIDCLVFPTAPMMSAIDKVKHFFSSFLHLGTSIRLVRTNTAVLSLVDINLVRERERERFIFKMI